MKFEEAFKQLLSGSMIRKKSWEDGTIAFRHKITARYIEGFEAEGNKTYCLGDNSVIVRINKIVDVLDLDRFKEVYDNYSKLFPFDDEWEKI